jgi:hypothetical protein
VAKVRLHRCGVPKLGPLERFHACQRVQDALDEERVDYEVVKESLIKGRRAAVIEGTGQKLLPAIEFSDGSFYREESKDMAARIRAGKLFEGQSPA